jgi:alkylation response protein AidB-like acyl-CoA dehydrogenase
MAVTLPPSSVLTDELLVRCHERAPRYDRESSFFSEDFDELCAAGYLQLALPTSLGGRGMSLADAVKEQRRLAYFAAPTAHAVSMHLAWTGVAAELWRDDDRSLGWVLQEAVSGQVFAAAHAEGGSDLPLFNSNTRAEHVDGGYRLTGHKVSGGLTPVWHFLGLHGVDRAADGGPRIVHAFMPRNTEGYATRRSSEALGMRAASSDDTLLDGAFIPERFVARVVPLGVAGTDPFVLALMAWSLLGSANVAFGMARRALDLTVDSLGRSRLLEIQRRDTQLQRTQRVVGEMGVDLEAIEAHLDHAADEWSRRVDHRGRWPMRLLVAHHHAMEGSWRVIDAALDLAGGAGNPRRAEVERLFRDARTARAHADWGSFTHDLVGRTLLGLAPDEVSA